MHSCNLSNWCRHYYHHQKNLHKITFSNYYQDNCDDHTEGCVISLKYLFIKVSGGTKGGMCKPSGKGVIKDVSRVAHREERTAHYGHFDIDKDPTMKDIVKTLQSITVG